LTRGIGCWLDPAGGSVMTTAPLPPTSHRTTSWNGSGITTGQVISGVTAPTEAQLNGVLQFLSRIHGGSVTYDCLGGDQFQNVVDNFTRTNSSTTNARYQVQQDAGSHEISLQVKVFSSTFGTVNFIPTQFNAITDATGAGDPYRAYILFMEMWELNFLEDLHAVDGEEGAGGQSGYAKAMWANNCLSPKGNGMIYNS